MIITGGENVYSLEVENVIASHEKVAEVSVIGIPNDLWGETVMAIVVPKENELISPNDIIDFCAERLAGYKKPRSVAFVDNLPKSGTGKVLKRQLREQYAKARK